VNDKSIKAVFWAMVAFFVLAIGNIVIDNSLDRELPVPNLFLPFITICFVLGIILLVLTLKNKVKGIDRFFLLLTGASALGLPVFVILHNLVTALIIKLFNLVTDFDEPVFFILAVVICPLGFLVGVVGTIVQIFKNKPGQLVN
jgi:hypothetical protein